MNGTMKRAMRIMERFGFTFLADTGVGKTPGANKRALLALERKRLVETADEGFGPVWRLTAAGREALADLEPVKV